MQNRPRQSGNNRLSEVRWFVAPSLFNSSAAKKYIVPALILLFLVLMCRSVFAIPANPAPFEARQPDGKTVRIHIRGDEWFHWYEDTDGYTVVCDNGRYAYGQLDKDNRLIATPLTVGVDNPKAAGLKKKTLPPVEVRRSLRPSLLSGSSESSTAPAAVPPSGTVKNLVVLCKFSDHTYGVHTRDAGDYDILFNQIGGDATLAPTGSVKDLYLENSYGAMTLESTVVAWVTLPQTEAYYADGSDGTDGPFPTNAQGMVRDALELVDPLVDFSQFDDDSDGYIDAIDIIHSGYGAETGGGGGDWIWSHRWSLWQLPGGEWTSDEGVKVYDYHTEPALWGTSGTNIVRFGVIAHETGHFFGLPDLYDTDGSGEGLGSWGMMANSWGFDNTQLHPPHFSAWSKIELGWVTPTVIIAPNLYNIDQAETNAQVYRIDYGYPSGEYLLIENRQPAGIETMIPQGGLCIYHIDEQADDVSEGYPGQAGWPANGNHYRVALLQADGSYDLEKGNNRGDSGDVYHGGGTSEISPATIPNTHAYQDGNIVITDNVINNISATDASMSFVYDNGSVPQPPIAEDVNISTQVNTAVTIELIGDDDGLPDPPAALDYILTSLPANGSLSDPNAAAIGTVPYTLTGGGYEVLYTPDSNYVGTDSFLYKVNDGGTPPTGGDSNLATVIINIIDAIYTANMDTNPGWSATGQWQWGIPTGQGGDSYGYPDPTSGYTGSKVYGINLNGDYSTSIGGPYYLTTQAIDCSGFVNVHLSFYRWLNSYYQKYVYATIEVSNNGADWTEVWENGISPPVTDSSWQTLDYDISEIADNQTSVYIRWSHRVARARALPYSGWNIDDVKLNGDRIAPQQYTLTVSSTTGGSVTSPGEGDFQYNDGTVVDLNAVGDAGYYFVNWTGDTSTVADTNAALTTITIDANYAIIANFAFSGIPPAITSTPLTTAVVGLLYTYDVNATGIPAPTFSLITSPNDMTIDANTGLIQWTPSTPTDANVTVHAENPYGSDSQNFIITVNALPEITSTPVTTAVVGQAYAYDVNATGTPAPTFSLIVSPNDMTIDANSGLIQWTPTEQDIGPNTPVTVRATNIEDFDEQSFTIVVFGHSPVIISQPLTTATADSMYYCDVDANGIPAPTYSLIVAPNDMTIDANTGLIQWMPDYFDIGLEIPVTVEATNTQDSNQQLFTINVLCGDNFNDNTKSAMWRSFHDSYVLTKITEDQNRLEILAPEPNYIAAAFFGNNSWTLDPNQDFALQLGFHYDLNSTPQGWVAISIENQQGCFAISAGADGNDSYYYYETVEDGNIVSEQEVRDSNEGTLYIWYDVDSNSMYLSHIGFNVEDAYQWQSVANPLHQDWTSPLNIFAGGGTQGDPLTGDVAHLDNFKLVKGSIQNWPPVTDLDGDGFIGLGDIAIIGENWLTDPNGPPDFDNNGTVDFIDFAELTNAY